MEVYIRQPAVCQCSSVIDGRRHAPFTGQAGTRGNLHLLFQSSHKTPHRENWPISMGGKDLLNSTPVTQTYKQAHSVLVYTRLQIYLCAHTWTVNKETHRVTLKYTNGSALTIQFATTSCRKYIRSRRHIHTYTNTGTNTFLVFHLSQFTALQINVLEMSVCQKLLKRSPPADLYFFFVHKSFFKVGTICCQIRLARLMSYSYQYTA